MKRLHVLLFAVLAFGCQPAPDRTGGVTIDRVGDEHGTSMNIMSRDHLVQLAFSDGQLTAIKIETPDTQYEFAASFFDHKPEVRYERFGENVFLYHFTDGEISIEKLPPNH